ncbi:MAG: acylneuraminate cytidylyltransferase family protein, partial [Flavobacteriaceae bacterium]|nr:acylneuraminate cytidylyltransferase family protein [Flavobacteriaceae bacterium]
MKILGLITARGGSKGIPGKNIKLLNGRPLIDYTISAAKESQSLSKTVLSSDDKRIIEFAQSAGIEVPFTRPVQLAKDDTPSIEVIKHALEFYKTSGEHYEAVCLLQPTTPF